MIPVLIDGLESDVALDRSYAAETLGSLGEEGAPALTVLEGLLDDECAGVRCSARIAIWRITGDLSTAVSVGVDLLDAENWLDRFVGVEHLGGLGPLAASSLWDLCRCLDDDDPCVRAAVDIAIERIEGGYADPELDGCEVAGKETGRSAARSPRTSASVY